MQADSHPHSPTPEDIMAYLDGEAPPESRAAIEAHLRGCKECEMVADSFRRVSQQVAEWAVEPSPATMQMPGRAERPRTARILSWRPSRFMLAGLTAAAAVVLVMVSSQQVRRPTLPDSATATAVRRHAGESGSGGFGRGGGVGGVVGGLSAAGPVAGKAMDRLEPKAMLQGATSAPGLSTPAVIRTASLEIVAKEFGGVRAAVEAIVAQAGGFIDQMTITGDTSTTRALRGTLRVPGDRLPATLARLRQLGQVVEDTQGSQDVTDQIVDLDARLASARATEQRLTELLRTRTGRLSDVLEVERELARVRLDIERLDAEKTNVGRRVSYATISVTIMEERKAGGGPLTLATRVRIAAADGLEAALESVAVALLFLLRAGPSLLLWGVAVGVVWMFARRILKPSA